MCGIMSLHTQRLFKGNLIADFLYDTAVFSIPLFFMVSGYLLLGRQNVDGKYVLHKIIGIIRFVSIITVANFLCIGIRHDADFWEWTVGSLFQKGGLGIFWYFGAMIIIYASLPVLNSLYQRHFKPFLIITALLALICSAIFSMNIFANIHVEQNTIQTFRLWNWFLYFMIGGVIRHYKLSVHWYSVLLLVVINYVFQSYQYQYMGIRLCEYFYSSIPVMALSVALFCFLKSMSNDILTFVKGGKLFLPCYTIHMFIIGHTINHFSVLLNCIGVFQPVLFYLFICSITILISWLIMKIPYMNYIFKI